MAKEGLKCQFCSNHPKHPVVPLREPPVDQNNCEPQNYCMECVHEVFLQKHHTLWPTTPACICCKTLDMARMSTECHLTQNQTTGQLGFVCHPCYKEGVKVNEGRLVIL